MGKPQPLAPQNADIAGWMHRLRGALFEAVTEDDIREIARSLVERAKGGDLGATRLLMTYVLGSPELKIKNAVVVGNGLPLPTAPIKAAPRSEEKILALQRRASNGQDLHDPRDQGACR